MALFSLRLNSPASAGRRKRSGWRPEQTGGDKATRNHPICRYFVLILALLLATAAELKPASSSSSLTGTEVDRILQRSREANERNWKAAPFYDYLECDLEKNQTSKTYQELMILGSRYERLVAINGNPLPVQPETVERDKLVAVVAERRRESPDKRNQRVSKYEKIRKRDQSLLQQLTGAFNFAYEGEQQLEGRQVYVLTATPRPDYRPPNLETQVLKGMKGRLWIDEETFNWVRVEAQVVKPVSIVGFLARVEPGTQFELEMAPVTEDVWLPSHFSMKARATVLLLFSRQSEQDETYSAYHPAARY